MPKVKVKQPDSTPPNPTRCLWSDSFYVVAYEAAKEGCGKSAIAERIGCNQATLERWIEDRPALKEAIEKGKARTDETFRDFIYRHLPPDLKALYTEIESLADEGDPYNRIQKLLTDKGDHVKQHLFIYAMVESDFDPSQALAKLRISKPVLDRWVRTDHNFGRLVEEIIFHKKNFLEGALMRLVKSGDKGAIVFANRTLNADRGYGNTLKVAHEGNVNVSGQVALTDLPLSLEDKKRILKAIKEKQNQLPEHVEDAEFTEK